MKIVVDINGYYNAESAFVICEYSMVEIDYTSRVIFNHGGIIKPEATDITQLDQVTMKNSLTHQTVHGIPFGVGTIASKDAASKIAHDVSLCRIIFMADEARAESFRSYLEHSGKEIKSNYSFICLDALGYQVNTNHDKCEYHMGPNTSCAKGIVLDMLKFVMDAKLYRDQRLGTLHTVVDFTSFESSFLSIKELAMIYLDYYGNPGKRTLMVIKPTDTWLKPDVYNKYLQKHGIDWKAGDRVVREIKQAFKRTFNKTLVIYVKDREHMEVLCEVDESLRSKIVRLDELGYKKEETEFMITSCEWHREPKLYNCADDNLDLMVCFIKKKKAYNATICRNLLTRNRTSFAERLIAMEKMHKYGEIHQQFDGLRDVLYSKPSTSGTQKWSAEQSLLQKRLRKYYRDYYGAHSSREFANQSDVIIISDSDSDSDSDSS